MDNALIRCQHSFFQTRPWIPYTMKGSYDKVIQHLMWEEHRSRMHLLS
jgi:hypothetical protein